MKESRWQWTDTQTEAAPSDRTVIFDSGQTGDVETAVLIWVEVKIEEPSSHNDCCNFSCFCIKHFQLWLSIETGRSSLNFRRFESRLGGKNLPVTISPLPLAQEIKWWSFIDDWSLFVVYQPVQLFLWTKDHFKWTKAWWHLFCCQINQILCMFFTMSFILKRRWTTWPGIGTVLKSASLMA